MPRSRARSSACTGAGWRASPPTICRWSRACGFATGRRAWFLTWSATRCRPRSRGQGDRGARPSRQAREVDRGQEQRARPALDVVDRRELFLAMAAAVARGHEDHPRRSDRRHVLGVVARARADAAVSGAGGPGSALDRVDDVAVERGVRHTPVVLQLVPHAFALAGLADHWL